MSGFSRTFRYALGTIVAAVALYASFRNVSHDALRHAIHAASLSWTGLAVVSTLATIALVTWRSGLLLDVSPARHWAGLWNAVVIGQATNIVLPLRFGEAARVASIANRTGWPVGGVVMALAVERFCDIGAFASLVAAIALLGGLPPRLAGVVPGLLIAILLTLAAVIAGIRLLPRLQASLTRPGVPRGRASAWLARQSEEIARGWRAIMRGRRATAILLLTGAVLAASVSTNYFVLRAFDLAVPPSAAFLLLVMLQLGTAVVSVPGNVGVFQYLTIVTLTTWQVDEPTALAAGLVLHVASLGPRVALGALAALSWRLARGDKMGRP